MVALESVEDELVVGYGVDGVVGYVVDFSADALKTSLVDAYDAVDNDGQQVGIGLEEVGTEQGTVLAVLDI